MHRVANYIERVDVLLVFGGLFVAAMVAGELRAWLRRRAAKREAALAKLDQAFRRAKRSSP